MCFPPTQKQATPADDARSAEEARIEAAVEAKLIAMLEAKIDASGATADQVQMLRALVGTVKAEPAMADVITRVVDGDGAGASEALAAAPEEVRATAAAKFAEGAALQDQGKWDEALKDAESCIEKSPTWAKVRLPPLASPHAAARACFACPWRREPSSACGSLGPCLQE